MILYFADRHLNVLGQASTHLPQGVLVTSDLKTEDIETGVSIFECDLNFTKDTRAKVESWAELGNYILKSSGDEQDIFTIIDAEIDTKKQRIYIYAEDGGLDLINEIAGKAEETSPHPIKYYIEKYAAGSGWEVGVNEVEGLTKQLSFDSEETTTARLLQIAEAFNDCELAFSFKINGLKIEKRYINIYAKRGKDTGVQLRLNKEIDGIITTKSISNLATALKATGGTPDGSDSPITLLGYEYDDGDFYIDGEVLKSRKALERWSRAFWISDTSQEQGGHIVKQYSDNSLSQAVLCENAIAELKVVSEMEINYEADIKKLPDNVKIGDRVNIIDDNGNLYLSSRLLTLETSEADKTRRAVIGEHLIKNDGISLKVEMLAAEFAKSTKSVERANAIASEAQKAAGEAKKQAETALSEAETAQTVADEAKNAADSAAETANAANQAANGAVQAVDGVKENVAEIENTVNLAKQAAENAVKAAQTAESNALTAKQQAENAVTNAGEAKQAAENAEAKADNAATLANSATATANTAKSTAENASSVASAAKADAQQAQKDIEDFGNSLETFEETITAEYARKTELTEAESKLQAQITKNAGEITSAVSQITVIDETANNAKELANNANATASEAKTKADAATAEAKAAQSAATQAKTAATAAQNNADTAKEAAENAKEVANKAETDLANAKADLAMVKGRVDATEEEIAAAEQAVANAQAAADNAQAEAETAASKAAAAQNTADSAVTNAANAQAKADEAAQAATAAQATADEAKGNASIAQAKANEASQNAAQAQSTANTAKTNADNAQKAADLAAETAANAQKAADEAELKATQAGTDLEAAKQNLADVSSRVGVTEEEVAAAQKAVEAAQAAADLAKQNAAEAQSTADTAKSNAQEAQVAATTAKTAADNAQAAADEAKTAADKAQADVNALTKRVTTAETKITQNTNEIGLRATKTEVEERINAVQIGGRNIVLNSKVDYSLPEGTTIGALIMDYSWDEEIESLKGKTFTMSVDVEAIDAYSEDTTEYNKGAGFEFYIAKADGTIQYFGIWIKLSTDPNNPTNVKKRLSQTFVINDKDIKPGTITNGGLYIQRLTHGAVVVSNPKVEFGNKATDWSPAPEDYYTKSEADAELTVKADEIQSSVTEVQTVVNGNSEKIIQNESLVKQLSDSLSTLITDGSGGSLMTQTENGWTFSTAEIQGELNKLSDALEQAVETMGETDSVISILQQSIDDLGKKTDYVNIGTYTYTNDSGTEVTEPCLELGESDSDYKVLITNTQILFKVGSAAPTRISKDGLITENITVENELRQTNPAISGSYVWLMDENGYYGLIWKE